MRRNIFAIITVVCLLAGSMDLSAYMSLDSYAADDTFTYSEDTWGFSSDELIDGENPYVTTTLRQKLLTQFGETETERIKTALASPLSDISYGMSLLTLLCYNGVWSVDEISNTASSLHETEAPVRKDALVSWINYYNMLQYTDDIAALDNAAIAENDASAVLDKTVSAVQTGTALLRVFKNAESQPVTLLIYGVESGEWNWSGSDYTSRILAADPGNTEFSDSSGIYFDSSSGKWIIPELDMSSENGAVLGVVINDVELLNKYGYDPSKLPRLILEPVVAYPGQTDIPITMMQAGIPESYGISMNADLCPAAEEIFSLSYDTESYDMGNALPVVGCTSHVNEQQLICTAVISATASSGIICSDYSPIISFLMDAADYKTVEDVAEKYGLTLQNSSELGDYYAFPMYFNTDGMSSYYADIFESDEFPLLMNSQIYVVMEPQETTTTTTTTTTTKASTTSIKASTTNTKATTTTKASTTTTKATTTAKASTTTAKATTTTKASTATTKATTTTTTVTTTATKATTTSSAAKTTTSSTSSTTRKSTSSISSGITSITTAESTKTTATTKKTTSSTTTAASTELSTMTTTASTARQEFEWGTDNWSMAYDYLGLQYIENGYGLMEEHAENLNASLSAMERVRIQNVEESEWLGAEYGMAVTEILAKSGVFDVSMWDPSADTIYNLNLDDERNLSIISYYQLLQETDAVQQEIAWTSAYMTQKSVLSNLIDQAAAAGKGGNMAIAAFFGENYAHAAIAYDVEYGLWKLGDKTYDGRILVADPYLEAFSHEACLYFSSSTLEWSVPMWNMSSSGGYRIGLASNSLSTMNTGGYFMGTDSLVSEHPYVPIIEVPADSSEFTLTPIGTDDIEDKASTELNWFSTIASMVTHKRAGLDYLAEGYIIKPLSAETVVYQMSYEDCLISVRADNAEQIFMMANGETTIMGNNSSYEFSITAETELPWESISVSGTGCGAFSAENIEQGLLLQGDSLEGAVIIAGSTSRTLESLPDGSMYTAVLISADTDGNMVIYADTDGDGQCETLLSGYQSGSSDVEYGDVNLDGIISMKDLLTVNKYIADFIILNEEALMNSDCDENMRINAVDAQLILRFLVLDLPVLPLSDALEMM